MRDELVPVEVIENKILIIRGQKVMLDRDLSMLYSVETKQLKRAVRRNLDRFPNDFMFTLNKDEMKALGCQFGTPVQHLFGGYHAYAFTEQGVAMLSSVLNSERAILVNIQTMRTFTKLRRFLASHEELRHKIEEMEKKYDGQFKVVFDAINEMLAEPETTKVKGVGFLK